MHKVSRYAGCHCMLSCTQEQMLTLMKFLTLLQNTRRDPKSNLSRVRRVLKRPAHNNHNIAPPLKIKKWSNRSEKFTMTNFDTRDSNRWSQNLNLKVVEIAIFACPKMGQKVTMVKHGCTHLIPCVPKHICGNVLNIISRDTCTF